MIIQTDSDTYGRIRKAYVDHRKTIKWLDIDGFDLFLKEHHARLVKPDLSEDGLAYACDELGVIVGKDMIEFANDQDYTIFSLKWL